MGRRAVNGGGGVRNQQRRNAKQSEARPHVDKYAAQREADNRPRAAGRTGDR